MRKRVRGQDKGATDGDDSIGLVKTCSDSIKRMVILLFKRDCLFNTKEFSSEEWR